MKFAIIQKRKYNYAFSIILFVLAIASLLVWGLKPGLDFTGGSLLEIKFIGERVATSAIRDNLKDLDLGDIQIQPAGEKNVILRFQVVNEEIHQKILTSLKQLSSDQVIEEKFESIGPVVGKELQRKAWMAIVLASVMIIAYIAYAFRKVSKPMASWKYGVAAIIALIHDLIITIGFFSVLGHFFGTEVDSMFVSAMLTILGFSIHDTIVVFDRTRENLARHHSNNFEVTVNDSINQTISRSINTSLTTLLVLLCLYIFGGKTIASFTIALLFGITIGTYSSIFVASPILVTWYNWEKKMVK